MLKLYIITSLLVVTWSSSTPCRLPEFQCSNKQCVNMNKYCNGLQDCADGSDEPQNCTPCNVTYFGEVGRTYELEVKRPDETQMPFLCFLNFTAAGGQLGELIQITFESFAVGTFESFTTEGCPDGYISISEGNRPPSHGKWCGSAWGYTVFYSETSSLNLTLRLDRFPQQQSSSGYGFEFKVSYRYLRASDARLRYGNATRRSYRGRLTPGTHCDRLLEGCARRPCRLQSPNYPGIYPRNVSCSYRVRERNTPPGMHALIALRQAHQRHRDHVPKFDNGDRVFRIWDQCNMMQDYIEILDGWGSTATTLAHLCSGETVPDIVSSGPELLVRFHTSPFGNPFHPLPLSYLPGFELEVQVFYVKKESPTYIEPGKRCEFVVSTFEGRRGLVRSPLHSLPPNTTCHYRFRGQPRDVVWLSFVKYHAAAGDLAAGGGMGGMGGGTGGGECDVRLQLWDGDAKGRTAAPLIGQFCKDDAPRLCDHSLLTNGTRTTRPCGLAESYVSTGPDLTVVHSLRYGTVLYPVHFMLRYEFVDLTQEGKQASPNPCDRIFKDSPSGKFYSPRITFLYGRGGQRDLTCTYQFESAGRRRLRLTFLRMAFGGRDCSTHYDPELGRWTCLRRSHTGPEGGEGSAQLQVSEFPWAGVEVARDCFCSNLTRPVSVLTATARRVLVNFTVTGMRVTDDHTDFHFDAAYALEPTDDDAGECASPWKTRRLRGSSGEISVRDRHQQQQQQQQQLEMERQMHDQNQQQQQHQQQQHQEQNRTRSHCLHQPWLIEPEDALSNFIYLKVRGTEKRDPRLCPTANRVVVRAAGGGGGLGEGGSQDPHVICPHHETADDFVEMFSEGWRPSPSRRRQLLDGHARSFIVEFVQRQPGGFLVTWMEVSRNPALALPASLLVINAPDCPHSCPELGACISAELWCDGRRHCPSGSDEQEANCALPAGFPAALLNSAALSALALAALTAPAALAFCLCRRRRRRRRRRRQKDVIVSVAEHTFLEFKSGLC